VRGVARILPAGGVQAAVRVIRRVPGGDRLWRWYEIRRNDAYLLSFPKCGRTWLRFMLGSVFARHFDLDHIDVLQLSNLCSAEPRIPVISVNHDDGPQYKTPAELAVAKTKYRGKKVILLVRDPRDAIVSMYFHRTRRRRIKNYEGTLSEFLRMERGSLSSFFAYYNNWLRHRDVPAGFLLLRYEDMHANAFAALRAAVDFLGLSEIADEEIAVAAQHGSFENMRRVEVTEVSRSKKLRPGTVGDVESYKTRRGKVGGYRDYLSEEDIVYVDERVRREMDPLYGYR